jgi:16S rRNA processing protein RimM
MQDPENRVAVGTIGKAIGLHGEVMVQAFQSDAEHWRTVERVWVGNAATAVEQHEIEAIRFAKRKVVLKFRGLQTREAVESLKNKFVFVDLKMLGVPTIGTYRIDEMIGASVVDESGSEIGVLKDVLRLPANDVWAVDRDGKEVLIPAVKEFVKDVRVKERKVVVRLIEGLLE